MTSVAYVTLHDSVPARPFWDQHLLDRIFTRLGWEQHDGFDPAPIVVVPGRMNWDREPELAQRLADRPVRALLVTSDEEGRFSWKDACPHADAWWTQIPVRSLEDRERFLPLGPPPHPPGAWQSDRDFDWCFAGQITHDRRRAAVAAAQALPGGLLVASDRFAAGLPPDVYTALLGRSRLVPCPSGPVHPETFRLYEALEAGAVPICDARTTGGDWAWWWEEHYPDRPFPVVDDWAQLPDLAPGLLDGWQRTANRCAAWWTNRTRDLTRQLVADAGEPDVQVTTVVTMSPIPSHPSLDVLDETLRSLMEWGPPGEIIVACDAPRPDDPAESYELAIAELCRRAIHDPTYQRVRITLADEWLHQAGLLTLALDHVRAPLLLFAEHDTPLCAPVPWDELGKVIEAGDANVIRLAHETHVHDEHRYLFDGDGPASVGGVRLWRTRQFSARPHLASVEWYRRTLTESFPPGARGFVEDRVYGPITEHDWEWAKLMLYAPEGNLKRSWHLDGRAGAEKAPAFVQP